MAYRKRISGSIDSYGWFRWTVQDVLSKHKDEEVHFVIMSPGGAVNEAIAISDLLAEHGNVTVEFSGLAASSATWLAFGAKRILMHEDTLWLCHKSSMAVSEWSQMNSEELQAYIDKLKGQQKSLEVIDAIIAKKYLDRASSKNKTLQQIVELMKEERYLPASDCLEWGFVDEVLPTKSVAEEGNVVVSNEFLGAVHLPLRTEEPQDTIEQTSLVEKIIQGLKSFFTNETSNNHSFQDTTQNVQQNNHNKEQLKEMKKDFVSINALLQVEGVETTDDKVTLTVDQFATIEAALKTSNEASDALDEISPKIKGISGLKNKVSAVAIMLDNAPVAPAQVAKPADETTKEVNVESGDAITNEARESYRRKKN